MRKSVRNRLNRLRTRARHLLDELEAIPQETLHLYPSPGAWSALQAVNHIYLSERLSIDYIKHKLSESTEFPRSTPASWMRSIMLKWALWSPLRYKSPKAVNMRENQTVLPVKELRGQWMKQYDELEELMTKYDAALRSYDAYRHPVVGRMPLSRMLVFFQDHQDHHRKQIQGILKKVQ